MGRNARKRCRALLLALILIMILGTGVFLLAGQGSGRSDLLDSGSHWSGVWEDSGSGTEAPAELGGEIYSRHAILVELSSGRVICEKASSGRTYPASLTKIMTAIVAIEELPDLDRKILLPESAFAGLYESDASMAGFLPGERVRVIDLLYGLMLPSGAEAAAGLACAVSGSEEDFVELMNGKAVSLGMKDTHYTNISGIHDREHYTTARDVAILLQYALKNPIFRDIFTCERYSTPGTNLHSEGLTFGSTLFQELDSPRIRGGAILGGKTGYTGQAGLCLASLAEKDGREYILVTTGAPGDHKSEQYSIIDAFYIYNNCLDRDDED